MYPYGCKNIQDIKIDDLVMGPDSKPRQVKKLYSGIAPMYRIKYHDGTYYDVNEAHTLALVCTGSKGKYTTGDKIEITVKDFLSLPKSYQNRFAGYKTGVDYSELPVIIPPYVLGLWLGDGSEGAVELTNIDNAIIGVWENFGKANGLEMRTSNNKQHRLVGGKDNVVMKAFKHYNLVCNKHIPKEYLFNSIENRR